MDTKGVIAGKSWWVLAVLPLLILTGCPGSGGSGNPPVAVAALASEPQAVTDDQGNFTMVWQSGNAAWARDYPQGVASAPFHLGEGQEPRIAVEAGGNAYVVYHRRSYESSQRNAMVLRRFDRATETWQPESRELAVHSARPLMQNIAAYDNEVLFAFLNWSGGDWNQDQRYANAKSLFIGGLDKYETGEDWQSPVGFLDTLFTSFDPVFAINGMDQFSGTVAKGPNNTGFIGWTQHVPAGVYAVHYPYPTSGRHRDPLSLKPAAGAVKSAMSASGYGVMAWVEHDFYYVGNSALRAAVYDPTATRPPSEFPAIPVLTPGEWGATSTIHNGAITPNDENLLAVDVDGAGNAVLLWAGQQGLVWNRYSVAAGAWQGSQVLAAAGNYGGVALGMAPAGSGMATWSVDGSIYISHFDPVGLSWSTAEKIGVGSTPDVAADNAGNCLVVWQESSFLYDYQCSDVTLTVTVTNNIGGRVTSQPGGIDCGKLNTTSYPYCTAPFDLNETVTLDARADAFYTLSGWGGDCAGNTGTTATVTMDAAKNCTATFVAAPPPPSAPILTVIIEGGPGVGEVTSDETPMPLMDCFASYSSATTTCTAVYPQGSDAVLYAMPTNSNSSITWTGCTEGVDAFEQPVCTLTMDADHTVVVNIQPAVPTHSLTLTINGQPTPGTNVFSTGSSTINAYCTITPVNPTGTTCTFDIPEGDVLLFDWYTPGGLGNPIQSWSGCTPELDANNRSVCRLTMDADHTVTATFGP